ncbi:MAG TPA: DASS family sodium-coupled anion symporter [Blastocatellia bacterium]|nr:DASS family sodium-coupled anion symporter [Blastocatellia bacterium]
MAIAGSTPSPAPGATRADELSPAGRAGGFPRGIWRWFVPPLTAGLVWLCPHAGFDAHAWGLLAIFAASISGLVARPLPAGAVLVIGVSIANALGLLTAQEALSGFANTTVWLIVAAFIFSLGFRETRLGERIACHVIARLGGSALRLGYALVISDLLLGPLTASNTARAGGVIYPITRSIAGAFGSEPGPTANRLGAFLMKVVYHGDLVVSAMFVTAMAANALLVELARQTAGVRITWTQWAWAALAPGLVGLALVPYAVYRLCPPEVQDTDEARKIARLRIIEMGPLGRAEKLMLAVFVPVLLLWVTEGWHGRSSTTVALVGVSALLVAGVIRWRDVLGERDVWDTLVWFGGIVMLAEQLNKAGLVKAFAVSSSALVAGWRWLPALVVLFVIYFFAHYAFASSSAHVSAMFPAFLSVALLLGAPPLLSGLAFGFCSNIYAATTHYGTGPAVVLYGAGYLSQTRWWRIGFVMSFVHLAIWLIVGFAWWKIIGLW